MKKLITLLFTFSLYATVIHGSPKKREDATCGVPTIKPRAEQATDANDRIVGGDQAIPYSWPWQIRFLKCDEKGENCGGWCGGSILNKKTVITAAHCVDYGKLPGNMIKIRVGAYDLNEITVHEQTLKVADYGSGTTIDNDVAVLTLESEITYNEHVSPICLPTKPVAPGAVCYVTGFGQTDREVPGSSVVLRQTQLQVLDVMSCEKNTHEFKPEKEICAFWKTGTSSCYGDSGGPFVCLNGGVWELQGVVSRGSKYCGDEPSIYAKVLYHMDFIKSRM